MTCFRLHLRGLILTKLPNDQCIEIRERCKQAILSSKYITEGQKVTAASMCNYALDDVAYTRRLLNDMADEGLLEREVVSGKNFYRRKLQENHPLRMKWRKYTNDFLGLPKYRFIGAVL